MSAILGNGTLATPGSAYYGQGGGGGGSTSTITTLYASTINVSTMNSEYIVNASSITSFDMTINHQLSVADNLYIGGQANNTAVYGTFGNLNLNASGSSTINLAIDNNITAVTSAGISTNVLSANAINDSVAKTQKASVVGTGNFYVPAAGTTQTLAQFSTTAGHLYQLEVPFLRVQNQPPGVPAVGAWADITIDTTQPTYCDTFDMASVSTIANDLQKSAVWAFTATAAGHNLQANGFLTNTLSTAITIGGGGLVFLQDLGAVTNMPVVG